MRRFQLRALVLCGLLACSGERASLGPVPTPRASTSVAASEAPLPPASASAAPSVAYTQPAPPDPPVKLTPGGKLAAHSAGGLVTSVEANATRAGVAVLEKGGNAVDAAVAVAYALAVTHPSAGNLGGGGFMLVRKPSGEVFAIDFRETAPKAATTKKVLAEIDAGAFGYASMAVPGTVAGLNLARDKFGTVPLADLVAPAIKLAKGHKLAARAATALSWQWEKLRGDPGAHGIFGHGDKPLVEGDRLVQKDLAKTLEAIAKHGNDGFYAGPVADAIVSAMKKNGGDITKEDLSAYVPVVRKPIEFSYRGFTIDTMPPPSMGGIAVAETLLSMERLHAETYPPDSATSVHLFVESAKRAYADRRSVGADPDFFGDKLPPDAIETLLSPKYLAERKPPIALDKATPSKDLSSPSLAGHESPETTHFSVVDKDGMAVSCTVTLSASFGSKVVIPGTGVLFSNALGGFSASGVNEVAPGKRMASSMSPTIVSRGGKTVLVVGSPGGDTIPNTTVQLLRNLIDYQLPVDEAVRHARVHHQFMPDEIRVEKLNMLPEATLKGLREMGHTINESATPLGDGKVILIDEANGEAWGYADTREGGLALGVPSSKEKAKH